ncbi:uncharacterized protein LOC130657532 [Hydractinia symbiolongicarpus]|uniref:uncharacterized protein LOC130657532 n=1 Tax=Hydractinia symbiolongicarpus TaxID=13093 RepID=UPI00254F7584|nr:uncharacterized protein LOC130657532 [Hydractinia symbiolongicarpus]
MAPKYMKWSEEEMVNAVSAVVDDGMSISEALRVFDIPRKTLSDKVHNNHPLKSGRQTELMADEEKSLVVCIKYMSNHAFPLTIPIIKSYTWNIVKRSGRESGFNVENGPGKTWWNEFHKRHLIDVAIRKPDLLDRGRVRMANPVVINRHFLTLGNLLKSENLMDKPGTIFNVDESGMNLELRKGKVVIDRSQKHAYSQGKGSREHVTVNCCVSPGGLMVPPFIIYEKSFPSGNYSANGPTDALYGKSDNGYMDEDLFFKWFTRLFVPKTKHVGKRILIIDGHGSHINLNLIDAARENQVILYCLPPHTAHVLQPLDVGLYGPLKTYFSRITDKIQIARLGITRNGQISKTEFSAVFKLEYEETFSYARILSSFRSCGIYPFYAIYF